ncbi:MAG: triose-phosphate isomerase [Dehalococcoidales bacterium]|jgi:triosephosphate isomerase
MRTPLISGNWKMNTTLTEAVALVRELKAMVDSVTGVEKVVCPPFISLAAVKAEIGGSSIKVGAQNLYFEEKGAYTGEISPLMLVPLCEYVIIGHSERRQYFYEDGRMVNRKLLAAQKVGLKPILCVGENLAENESGRTEEVLRTQIGEALSGVDLVSLVIAYEPIWAIGTGRPATGSQANKTAGFIRRRVAETGNAVAAQALRILYGGSVTSANAAEFLAQSDIDGALVGGASLKASDFASIVRQAAEAR